jgi:hypothetical protein
MELLPDHGDTAGTQGQAVRANTTTAVPREAGRRCRYGAALATVALAATLAGSGHAEKAWPWSQLVAHAAALPEPDALASIDGARGLEPVATVVAQAQVGRADCAAIEETDFERVVACMSIEELAGQLTAFNESIALRLTGKTLEDNVRAGLGTIMGLGVNPERTRQLQQLAQESGHPPLLSFDDTERGVRTILPS